MTDAFDLLAEARWEMEGVRRAAKRYQEAAESKDPAALPSGQKLLREVIPGLATAITELKLEGQDQLAKPGGARIKWGWPIQLLDSQTLALITVAVALGTLRGRPGDMSRLPQVSLDIGRAVRDEVEYRTWVGQQAKANKAAKEAEDWEHVDLLRALKARYPTMERSTWARWKRKLQLTEAHPWDKETLIQLGSSLISRLVSSAPDRFTIVTVSTPGGRSQAMIELSAETQEMMNDVETRASVSRPVLMPMIIPPIPWAYG